MITLNRCAVQGRGRLINILVSCIALLALSGCGGGMVNVKQAFDANPRMVVAEIPKDQLKIGLLVPGRENSKGVRGLARCASVMNCLVETRTMPAEYKDIADVVTEEMRAGLNKPEIKSAKGMNIPLRQNVIGPETPDWDKTEFDMVIQPSISVTYTETISTVAAAPFTYSLDGSVTILIRRKDAKGDWEVVKPNMFGYVEVARVSKKIDMTTSTYKSIEELQAMLPPSAIANELREKTREGMKKFIAEMKAAK